MTAQPRILTNIIYSELSIGQSASLVKQLTSKDIALFGYMSGDLNPAHFNREYAQNTVFKDVIAHGMWSGSLISTVLGTQLPGPGTVYLSQALRFSKPIYVGDEITTKVTVTEKKDRNKVVLECVCTNQRNEIVTSGVAEIIAPTQSVSLEAVQLEFEQIN